MPLEHAAWAIWPALRMRLLTFSISKSQHFSIYPKMAFRPDVEGLK